MSKHTPGPWLIWKEEDYHLVLARDEVLAACEEGLSFMESVIEFNEMRGNTTPPDVIELRDRFSAAIAKATGEAE
jgi:hypothetical protein